MSRSSNFVIKVKDFSVSKEEFDLVFNKEFDCLETTPQPDLEHLGSYYESEKYISHTDASKSFVDKLYQTVKKYTLRKKFELILKHTSGNSILDVGCGTGDFLKVCQDQSLNVVGVEPNAKARELAASKLKDTTQLFSDLFELNTGKFDVITMWHVLEHIPNLEAYIEKLTTLLNTGGVLLVAVPNYKSYDAKHYKEFWAAYDVPRHLWHFSKKSIKKLFKSDQYEHLGIKPMLFDSFYVSILSEKYKTEKSNLIKAFFIGLISNISGIFSKEYSSHIYILKKK